MSVDSRGLTMVKLAKKRLHQEDETLFDKSSGGEDNQVTASEEAVHPSEEAVHPSEDASTIPPKNVSQSAAPASKNENPDPDESRNSSSKSSRSDDSNSSSSSSRNDDSNSSSSSSSDDSSSEVDDSDADKDYIPLAGGGSSSEDEGQEDCNSSKKTEVHTGEGIEATTSTIPPKNVSQSAAPNSSTDQTPELIFNSSASTSFAEQSFTASVISSTLPISDAEVTIEITECSSIEILSPIKKGKRRRNESTWKKNLLKLARNSGKEYKTCKRARGERRMKPPCTEKCRLKCSERFSEEERKNIFESYWNLGECSKQREFIKNCTEEIKPRYRYVREGGTRPRKKLNSAFYFNTCDRRIRVCKLFFRNTLDINDRPIRTVFEKKDKVAGAVMSEDGRGKHGKHPKMDEAIKRRIIYHINKIPKIESHYTRKNTTKHYIEGGKSITDIYADYVNDCKRDDVVFCNYNYFYHVFTNEFNISFFQPKKDQCETCLSYENASEAEKVDLKEIYDTHLVEKELSRKEKDKDKETLKGKALLSVYDLQAAMSLPKGECSAFYYASKLNVLNFTITELLTKTTECYVWDESNGCRGSNEIGSCILKYIEKHIGTYKDVTFYSDNCAGQQKNQYIIAAYIYALHKYDINSITHKFLIKGHTQNEGDSVHSLIERKIKQALRSGPIYTPEGIISLIRTARRTGSPFSVNELSYEDFVDLKRLNADIGPLRFVKNKRNEPVQFQKIKVLRVEKTSPDVLFYKLSYSEPEFMEAIMIKKKKPLNVALQRAFTEKIKISDHKKKDLMTLIEKNCIPNVYKSFYESL